MHNSRQILNIKVDFLNKGEVLSEIDALLSKEICEGMPEDSTEGMSKGMSEISSQILCTTNPEFILAAQKDPEFADIINNSFLSVKLTDSIVPNLFKLIIKGSTW